ncbi:hypothetical protein DMC30DRAFT_207451 [Rhodotorula diobovata]|uniref:Zn(2)-C6 fungal-type domain-containing protein n=1 Tax=Rhodotorula diobovata TaxID=5288 RepID=A0A5C5FWQ9_9BASI|nr:hypothetical protein DMC30DRAFT_207451 [Rhodotorula diobovata]
MRGRDRRRVLLLFECPAVGLASAKGRLRSLSLCLLPLLLVLPLRSLTSPKSLANASSLPLPEQHTSLARRRTHPDDASNGRDLLSRTATASSDSRSASSPSARLSTVSCVRRPFSTPLAVTTPPTSLSLLPFTRALMSSLTPPLSPSSGSTSPDNDSHMCPPPPPLDDDDGHGDDRSLGDGGDPRHLLSAPPSATRLADRFQTLARISTAAFDEAKEEERLRRGVAFTPRSHSHAHHPGARRDSSASTSPPSPPPPKPPQPSSRHFAPQRTSSNVRNCDGCRRRKTKCHRGRPCGNCASNFLPS